MVTSIAVDVGEEAPENRFGTPESSYFHGNLAGPAPTRFQLLTALGRAACTFGRAPASNHLMLVMADPSACTLIAPPAFSEIWR